MSRRAVVLEVGPGHAVVLLEGGEVRRLPRRDASMASVVPGQEIWVPERNPARLDHAWGRAAAAVAAVLIVGGGYLAMRPRSAPVAAWVSVDINPSINLGVSASGRVVEAQALDAAGVRILAQIPHLRGTTVDAAVGDVARAARADGYLQPERGQASFIVLAGAPVTGTERAFTAQQVRAAAGALELLVRPFGSTVVTLPLGRPADVRDAASYHLSLGRYLLGKLTREPWSRVGEASLRQILSQWPLNHERVPSSASSGSPSAPPSSGAGGASNSSPDSSGSRTPSSPSQTGSPAIAGTVVAGVLTGVGPDSVVVNGTSYPVSQDAVLVVNRVEVPLSLAIVILLQGQTASLTIEGGAVVRLTATLALTRQNPLPIFPPATASPPSSLAS